MNFMKISKFFSDSKNGFGTFLVKHVFHQLSDFPSQKKNYSSKWVGEKFPSFFQEMCKSRSHSEEKVVSCHKKHGFYESFEAFFPR